MVENVGLSLKERMAALQSASKSSSKSSPRRENKESPRASVAVAVAATGAQLKAGFLKRSAGEGKLADVFYRRFTALYSDPMLCFFEDEERSRLKGSVHLARGTTCESGPTSMVLVSVPASGDTKAKQLKLQFPTAEEAADWLRALTGALAEAYPQAPAPAPAPAPVSTESVVLTTQPAAAAPAPEPAAPPEPTKRGSSFWRPTFHETSIMMGGVELGGENAPPRRKSSFAAPVLALARSVSKLLTRSPSSFDGDLGDGDLESMSDSEDEEEKVTRTRPEPERSPSPSPSPHTNTNTNTNTNPKLTLN